MLLTFALVDPSQTFAQTAGAVNPIQKLREIVNTRKETATERKEDLIDLRNKISSSTEEAKARVEAAREKIASSTTAQKIEDALRKLSKNIGNVVDRLEATIEREEAIMAKIVSRIEKIKAIGGQTADAEKLVTVAKNDLSEAKTALQNLKVATTGVITEPTASSTKDIFPGGKNTIKKASSEVEKYLREAHQALQKSVGSLKGVSQLKNATTTQN